MHAKSLYMCQRVQTIFSYTCIASIYTQKYIGENESRSILNNLLYNYKINSHDRSANSCSYLLFIAILSI